MADVRINNRSELDGYGRSIKNFSDSYAAEANALYRQFTDKAGSDSRGQAINAYFAKLNSLQDQVFTQLPLAIKAYGEVVTTYTGAISGAGFGDECFSSDSGAESLSKVLTGEQSEVIFNTSNALDAAFSRAADAMETDVEKTKNICEQATSGLSEAASKRVQKDQEVQTAYSSFTNALETATSDVSGYQAVLTNAQYMTIVSSSVIFAAIAKGRFTADEMYYLDTFQSKEDAQALEAILSDKPGDVLKVDPKKISETMYVVLADEMNDWTTTGDHEMWEQFSSAMGDNTVDRNNEFTNGILIGEDALAEVKKTQMFNLYQHKPVLPANATPEQQAEYDELLKHYKFMYEAYQSELDVINSVSGLMNSLQFLEIGTSEHTYTPPTHTQVLTYFYDQKSATINLKDGEFTISTSKRSYATGQKLREGEEPNYGDWYENKEYTAGTEHTDFGMAGSEYSKKLNDLREEREKAHYEMTQKIVTAGIETGISFIPFGGTALSAIKTLGAVSELNFSEVAKEGPNIYPSARDDYKELYKNKTGVSLDDTKMDGIWDNFTKVSSGASDALKAYAEYQSQIDIFDKQADEAKVKEINKILDYGGWELSEATGSTVANGRGHYHDFNASLRAYELNTQGLKGYINNQGITPEDLDASIDKTFTNKEKSTYSDVIAYAKGEETDLTLAQMSAEQLEKFNKVITNIKEHNYSDFGDYLRDEYETEDSHKEEKTDLGNINPEPLENFNKIIDNMKSSNESAFGVSLDE